jgi:hypothetical protein
MVEHMVLEYLLPLLAILLGASMASGFMPSRFRGPIKAIALGGFFALALVGLALVAFEPT